jgi:transcriptional regulator with XRE-family HTH domain
MSQVINILEEGIQRVIQDGDHENPISRGELAVQVATASGSSREHVRQVIHGEAEATPRDLEAFAQVLHLPLTTLQQAKAADDAQHFTYPEAQRPGIPLEQDYADRLRKTGLQPAPDE